MNREEWLKKLSEMTDGNTATWAEEHGEKARAKFFKDLNEGKVILTAYGAFGPENDKDEFTDAYIEEVINPEEGGTFIKYYGCPILYAGMSSLPVVRAMRIPKYLFSGLPKDIMKYGRFLPVALALEWFFNRNGLLEIVRSALWGIHKKVLEIIETWPEKSYNKSEQEIYRALILAMNGKETWVEGKEVWEGIIYFGARFLRTFFFVDNTYKSRVQDALYKAKNLIHALDILISREVASSGSTQKIWKIIRFAFKIMRWTSPTLRKIEKKFFEELDKEKVKMTEADEFFSNLYKSYNFRGLPREERKKQWQEQVKKHKVVFLMYSASQKNKF